MAAQWMPLVVVGIAFVIMAVLQRQFNRNVNYQCSLCGAVFSLDPIQGAIAPHSFGKKYVRCPNCGEMTWAVPVPKEN